MMMVKSEEYKVVFKVEIFMDLVKWMLFYLNFSGKIISGIGRN